MYVHGDWWPRFDRRRMHPLVFNAALTAHHGAVQPRAIPSGHCKQRQRTVSQT